MMLKLNCRHCSREWKRLAAGYRRVEGKGSSCSVDWWRDGSDEEGSEGEDDDRLINVC